MIATETPAANELVATLDRTQGAGGLFPTWRWRGGARERIDASPFATTFVVHAVSRVEPMLGDGATRTAARRIALRARAALAGACDADGRVRFLGPGSAIRPDVDDTACVWLARTDAGETCPAPVLDALERAALASGGYANDFETTPPHAVEIASTAQAIALLERSGRVATLEAAAAWVEREADRVTRGEPRGFFFPSRLFAAFCVVRAAVDLGASSLAPAAQKLAAWTADVASADAPSLERAWALWILEASGARGANRSRLRDACLEDAHARAGASTRAAEEFDGEPWFLGDPRSVERDGVVVLGARSVGDAVLLDALALPESPTRRLEAAAPRQTSAASAFAIRFVEARDGVARFEASGGGATHVIEAVADAPGVDAYRRAHGFAVRYRGRDARAASAADAVIASGALGRIGALETRASAAPATTAARRPASASAPRCLGGEPASASTHPVIGACTRCMDADRCARPSPAWIADHEDALRPRLSDEPLADVLRFAAAADLVTRALVADVAELRAAASLTHELEVELSFKVDGDTLLEGPRLTFYQHRPDTARVLDAFARLAGSEAARALARELAPACEGLPLHLGVVHGPGARAVKLYARTDAAGAERARAVVAAALPDADVSGLDPASVHGIGLACRGEALRVRAYVTVPSARVTDDARADSFSLEGWDLSAEQPPALESRYVHYRGAHLSWSEACSLAKLGPALGARIGDGLRASGRWYARFFGLPCAGAGRSVYITLGPTVPRATDDGP